MADRIFTVRGARALDARRNGARRPVSPSPGGASSSAPTRRCCSSPRATRGAVRNPLAEPGVLGITAGAGLGAAAVVTSGLPGGRPVLIVVAVAAGLATFAVIALLAWRGGFLPDRFVLIGIGYGLSSVTTFLLLRADPYNTPRIFTWLSGTTYGRTLPDVVPVAVALALALPLLLAMRFRLDLLAVDEDAPAHRRRQGGADPGGRPGRRGGAGGSQLGRGRRGRLRGARRPAPGPGPGGRPPRPLDPGRGLMIPLVGAPYFVWVLRRSRA